MLPAAARAQPEVRRRAVIDILLGKQTAKVIQYDHDSLTVFGIGTELGEAEWRGVVRQLLAQGLLAVEGDYGTLVLTEASARGAARRARGAAAPRAASAAPRGRAGRGASDRRDRRRRRAARRRPAGVRAAAGLAGGDRQGAGRARPT